ncbi:hypothetical protein D3C87_1842060 [compost metagenome]
MTSIPVPCIRVRSSPFFKIVATSLCIFLIAFWGILAGAYRAMVPVSWTSIPASLNVGTFGSIGERSGVDTAKAFTFPALTSCAIGAISIMSISISPETIAGTLCPALL